MCQPDSSGGCGGKGAAALRVLYRFDVERVGPWGLFHVRVWPRVPLPGLEDPEGAAANGCYAFAAVSRRAHVIRIGWPCPPADSAASVWAWDEAALAAVEEFCVPG